MQCYVYLLSPIKFNVPDTEGFFFNYDIGGFFQRVKIDSLAVYWNSSSEQYASLSKERLLVSFTRKEEGEELFFKISFDLFC